MLNFKLEPVAGRIIHKAQTTFIEGRNVMNYVLALHETKREKIGVVLKIDFEKVYDKVY
jgi:hypothetical protein